MLNPAAIEWAEFSSNEPSDGLYWVAGPNPDAGVSPVDKFVSMVYLTKTSVGGKVTYSFEPVNSELLGWIDADYKPTHYAAVKAPATPLGEDDIEIIKAKCGALGVVVFGCEIDGYSWECRVQGESSEGSSVSIDAAMKDAAYRLGIL